MIEGESRLQVAPRVCSGYLGEGSRVDCRGTGCPSLSLGVPRRKFFTMPRDRLPLALARDPLAKVFTMPRDRLPLTLVRGPSVRGPEVPAGRQGMPRDRLQVANCR
jgi:hypothetical protein